MCRPPPYFFSPLTLQKICSIISMRRVLPALSPCIDHPCRRCPAPLQSTLLALSLPFIPPSCGSVGFLPASREYSFLSRSSAPGRVPLHTPTHGGFNPFLWT
jgi:hypothetical protein